MKTQPELRAFVWGIMAGLGIVVACFVGVSQIAGVRWQPVKFGAVPGYCNFDSPKGIGL